VELIRPRLRRRRNNRACRIGRSEGQGWRSSEAFHGDAQRQNKIHFGPYETGVTSYHSRPRGGRER
jgi:hypothetical protein